MKSKINISMRIDVIFRISIFLCIAFSVIQMAGCSSLGITNRNEGTFRILKVNRSLNKDTLREPGFTNAGRKHLLGKHKFDSDLPYEEQGEELIVIWRYDGPVATNAPVKLYFDYNYTGEDKFYRVTELYNTLIPGRHEFFFRNVGDNYFNHGQIEHWRASLYYNDTEVAEKESVFFGHK